MSNEPNEDVAGSVVSNRTMNIAVALALMIVATVVMIDSYKLGAGWAKDVGPDSGYFPFYVSLIMFVTSGVTLIQHLFKQRRRRRRQLHRLWRDDHGAAGAHPDDHLRGPVDLYRDLHLDGAVHRLLHDLARSLSVLQNACRWRSRVPVALFVVFEIWFLVPLPKGPFEAWLGY